MKEYPLDATPILNSDYFLIKCHMLRTLTKSAEDILTPRTSGFPLSRLLQNMKIGLGMYNMQDSLEVVTVYVVGTFPALVFLQQPVSRE